MSLEVVLLVLTGLVAINLVLAGLLVRAIRRERGRASGEAAQRRLPGRPPSSV